MYFFTYDTNEAACIINFLHSKTFPRTLATNSSPLVKLSIEMPIIYSRYICPQILFLPLNCAFNKDILILILYVNKCLHLYIRTACMQVSTETKEGCCDLLKNNFMEVVSHPVWKLRKKIRLSSIAVS